MLETNEMALRRYVGAVEAATGRTIGEGHVQAARVVGEGRIAVVPDREDGPLVAALAAALIAGNAEAGEGTVHLATANAHEADRLRPAFDALGLADRVVCAFAESFAFDRLRGALGTPAWAIVSDADRSLLHDADTPVILTGPPPAGILATISAQTAAEANRALVRGRDYEVEDGQIVVRDPKTGDLRPGRRFSAALHAAVEMREGIVPAAQGVVVAQTTLRDHFRAYPNLGGVAVAADPAYAMRYGLTTSP